MEIQLKENERIDDLERNGYRIIQNRSRFCFGMDAVLLSGFVCEGETGAAWSNSGTAGQIHASGIRIADLGTGTGIIPLLLHGKLGLGTHDGADSSYTEDSRKQIIGIEIQEEVAEMARRSVRLNDLQQDIGILPVDLKQASAILGKNCFDVVTSNPPYMKHGGGLSNPDRSKAISRHEVMCTFDDVAFQAADLLKKGGRFYLVHRPERLAELIVTLKKHSLEPKRMRLVHSFADSQATMVLLESVKGGKAFLKVEKPLVIYREKGIYTDEILKIYHF